MPAFAPKPNEVIALYKEGLSTREVADLTGIGKTAVAKLIKEAGVSRSKRVAAKPTVPHKPESTHWRTMRNRSRKLWIETYGEIQAGYHVHHIDEDPTNNALSNLELVEARKHVSKHSRGPEYHIPRHKRTARKAYMKKYLKEYQRG